MFEGMFEIFNEEKGDEETEIVYPRPSSRQAFPSSGSSLFVVSIGGSIVAPGKPDPEAVQAVANCVNELLGMGVKIVLVVGGGKIARDYVAAAKASGANNFELDDIGIAVTRANARLLIAAIDNAFPSVLDDIRQAKSVIEQGKVPVFGGLVPGFTTDAVAALLAEYLGARFVNLSNVDGIFSADPAMHPSARMYREISYSSLIDLLLGNSMKPSQNLVIDLPAAMVLKRSGITGFFLGGHDLENFKQALLSGSFHGTLVGPDSEDAFVDEPVKGTRVSRLKPVRKRVSRKPARKRVSRKPARKPASRKPAKRRVSRDEEELDPDQIRF